MNDLQRRDSAQRLLLIRPPDAFWLLASEIARSRTRSFCPLVIQLFQRRPRTSPCWCAKPSSAHLHSPMGRVIASLQLGPLSALTVPVCRAAWIPWWLPFIMPARG